MRITDVLVEKFTYTSRVVRDAEGHGHPGPEHEAVMTLLRIVTDEGVEGYSFGVNPRVVEEVFRPHLVGKDPFYREEVWQMLFPWQRMHKGLLTSREIAHADLALWDLAGRCLSQPVYKLIGARRDKVPAYASTMCGDELEGGLNTPQAYADFAIKCMERGYPAFKLHTWMPPISWAPDPKMDVAACRAVREAVGPDVHLMLDCYHNYTREEALWIGRQLEKLDFHWLEEPMDEYNVSSYVWLCEQLDIPVVGPETADGHIYTRAEWIVRKASDISRVGVFDVGGITPALKIVHLCESFGMRVEVHGGGPGNLHLLCAMGIPGEYYERGLLHPFLEYDEPPPWLNELPDPMDREGFVHVPQKPGLGWDINWDYINAHRVD